METFQVLTLSIALLFGLGLLFSILLWCRNWRREELEAYQDRLRQLTTEVNRLREAVEMLDETSASLQMADGQLSDQIESLRNAVGRLRPAQDPTVIPRAPEPVRDTPQRASVSTPETSAPERDPAPAAAPAGRDPKKPDEAQASPEDRNTRVREMLAEGRSDVEIAKALDMGLAEVRMIARLIDSK